MTDNILVDARFNDEQEDTESIGQQSDNILNSLSGPSSGGSLL